MCVVGLCEPSAIASQKDEKETRKGNFKNSEFACNTEKINSYKLMTEVYRRNERCKAVATNFALLLNGVSRWTLRDEHSIVDIPEKTIVSSPFLSQSKAEY